MITPSYSLTATERVLPKLALDFTTAALDPRVTFTRTGNTATVTNSSGVIVGVNADIPRFDFDPVTLVCRGLLIEESRTNVLLNSLIDGTSLATQAVVVTAAARTLSFYGTGQIVLSGAASATVTGTGAYPTRTTFTFTPSAGVLTLTVTGTVQFAQLEAGAFATSYIPTEVTALTRNADVATMTGTNFSDWYNATEGTFEASWQEGADGVLYGVLSANDGTSGNKIDLRRQTATSVRSTVDAGGLNQATLATSNNYAANKLISLVSAYKADSFAASSNASAVATDTSGLVPTVNQLQIGGLDGATVQQLNGWLQQIKYWPQRLINAEVQAFSKV
jgi:hypothetical protein